MKTRSMLNMVFVFVSLVALALPACAPAATPPVPPPVAVEARPAAPLPAPTKAAPPPVSVQTAPSSNYSQPGTPVTAGVVDDNQQWSEYLNYRDRHQGLRVNDRDITERYIVRVVDAAQQPVHDAVVQIYAGQQLFIEGRTDAGGQLLFHPRALDPQGQWGQVSNFTLVARKGQVTATASFARGREERWTITLNNAPMAEWAQLDLLFLIDATGSMGDEIDKLKTTMQTIANEIGALPERPDVRYGLVAYRDRGDAFVVRSYDFTSDLGAFQRTLASLQACCGGDEPESVNEALHRSIHELSWRSDNTVRLVLLVADAPPHLDYQEQFSYDTDMIMAVRKGIKVFPIGASGLNAQGEYIFRQLAQFTGGKFVFLTYAQAGNPSSGPGTQTDHDVTNYSVDTLDRLVVRLVREELAKLPHKK